MKFLIQTIEKKIQHDFSFELIKAIEFLNWANLEQKDKIVVKYLNCEYNGDFSFKNLHRNYVPVGSVEFVSAFLNQFFGVIPKPMNVPTALFPFCCRDIENINHMDLEDKIGRFMLKSNDTIKGFHEPINIRVWSDVPVVPAGNYQLSELIDIDSEWRAFVYRDELVGLQNYTGDFTMFPDVEQIKLMISQFKDSPIAYTLDVGVHDERTFPIECHDFFSCGLYGFSDYRRLPLMLHRWFKDYINGTKY